jgi:hypothetical protein
MRHDIYTNNSINIFTARLRGSSYKSKKYLPKYQPVTILKGDLSQATEIVVETSDHFPGITTFLLKFYFKMKRQYREFLED